MKVLLKGIRTTWAHDAIVYDEKPLTFKQAWNQRKRWAQGHFDIAGRYIPTMIKEGIRRRDIRLLDGVLHLVQPHFLLMSTFFVIASYASTVYPFYTNVLERVLPLEVWTILAFGQYIFSGHYFGQNSGKLEVLVVSADVSCLCLQLDSDHLPGLFASARTRLEPYAAYPCTQLSGYADESQ